MVLLQKNYKNAVLLLLFLLVVIRINYAKYVPEKNLYFSKNYMDFSESKSYNAGARPDRIVPRPLRKLPTISVKILTMRKSIASR